MAESFVQVPPDSTGKQIRNLAITVLQPDGSTPTVYMQVIAIADASGNPYTNSNELPVQDNEAKELLARQVQLLETIVDLLGE